jgi:hydrogenase expression/formation protein HypE
MVGKVSPEDLKNFVFSRVGAASKAVQVGPAYGEDTAAIEIGDEVLVINSDPIIYAAEGIGTLGVNIASNDIAASGGEPEWMTVTYLLPDGKNSVLDTITRQIDEVASDLGIAIVGGHSEFVPEIERPFLSLTCLGRADRYIPTSGAKPGDRVILTKGAGVEGTGIIATDFRPELEGKVEPELLERGEKRLTELSVVPEASVLNDYATAMHDPTEGGLVDGLFELSAASATSIEIDRSKIFIGDDTKALCGAMGVDPLKIFGSGALLATVPEDRADEATETLINRGISASVIGKVEAGKPELVIGEEVYREPIQDQLYDLWD